MDLYKEILVHVLKSENVSVILSGMEGNIADVVDTECYKILCDIRNIVADSSLDDKECFWKIEKIVRVFEENGIGCGGRHDF